MDNLATLRCQSGDHSDQWRTAKLIFEDVVLDHQGHWDSSGAPGSASHLVVTSGLQEHCFP